MIRIRDDDVLMYKGDWKDPYKRFREVHDLILNYDEVIHVPAVITNDILVFPDAIRFIREETLEGRMNPEWHGMYHIDYAKVKEDKIIEHIEDGQFKFKSWFDKNFTKFYTPWGANSNNIVSACSKCGIDMIDCSAMVRCVHINKNPEIFYGKDIEILIHWWEGKDRLRRALDSLTV
jgi:hypothetical protein